MDMDGHVLTFVVLIFFWTNVSQQTFNVVYDGSIPHNSYLGYEQVGSSAAKTKDMYVILKNQILNTEVHVYSATANKATRARDGKSTATHTNLCQLKMYNSTCLVRRNFIAEIISANGDKIIARSDVFSAWWGDSSYNTANTTMVITQKNKVSSYLTMTNAGYGLNSTK